VTLKLFCETKDNLLYNPQAVEPGTSSTFGNRYSVVTQIAS